MKMNPLIAKMNPLRVKMSQKEKMQSQAFAETLFINSTIGSDPILERWSRMDMMSALMVASPLEASSGKKPTSWTRTKDFTTTPKNAISMSAHKASRIAQRTDALVSGIACFLVATLLRNAPTMPESTAGMFAHGAKISRTAQLLEPTMDIHTVTPGAQRTVVS